MTETTHTLYVRKDDVDNEDGVETFTEGNITEEFNELLDESWPAVEMLGMTFYPSRILLGDPIAHRESLLNYIDSEYFEFELPWEAWVDVVINDAETDTVEHGVTGEWMLVVTTDDVTESFEHI